MKTPIQHISQAILELWCDFRGHKWGPWTHITKPEYHAHGRMLTKYRECRRCGFRELSY